MTEPRERAAHTTDASAPASTALPPLLPPERLSGALMRELRRFHAQEQAAWAVTCGVSVRTVIRWEQRGVDPAKLPIDTGASDPHWRNRLLAWCLRRYKNTGSPDTRQKAEATHVS